MQVKSTWSYYGIDFGNSAFAMIILTSIFPLYFPSLVPGGYLELSLFGLNWKSTPLSLFGYSLSAGTFLSVAACFFLSPWADRHRKRKLCMAIFTSIGVVGGVCLGLVSSWQAALSCFVLAHIGFVGNSVFNNSLLPQVAPKKDWDQVSSSAFGWGYLASGIVLVMSLLLISKFEWFQLASKADASRLSFIVASVWWAVFTLPSFFYISEKKDQAPAVFGGGLRALLDTFKELLKSKTLLLFIVAYALFNDGIQTVLAMGSIFGKEVLSLQDESIIKTLLVIQFVGWPMTIVLGFFSKKWGAKRVLLFSLVVWTLLTIFASQMRDGTDFLLMGIGVGLVVGISQALPRSIYARLIPQGKEAEFFSLYALSGKLTASIGPAFFAIVRDITDDARLAILSLIIFFVVGTGLLKILKLDPQT